MSKAPAVTGGDHQKMSSARAIPEGHELVPPDGGWGWVIAGGSLLITIMLSIPVMSFGILLKDMQQTLGLSTSEASWTASVSLALSQMISPVVTVCIHHLSCRKTAVFGGLVLTTGLILSSFARDMSLLLFGYGFLSGIGSGFCRISCMVIGSQYFHENFSIFAGLIFAGFSIGRMVFTPITEWIREEYGYQNTYFLVGGLCLNVFVGASLFQPVKRHLKAVKKVTPDSKDSQQLTSSDLRNGIKGKSELVPKEEADSSPLSQEMPSPLGPEDQLTEEEQKQLLVSPQCSPKDTSILVNGFSDLSPGNQFPGLPKTGDQEVAEVETTGRRNRKSSKCLQFLRKSLDFSLLKESTFYIICASSVLAYLTVMYSNVFLIPLALEKGLTAWDSSLVVTAKSVAEIVGRLGGPWVQKLIRTDPVILYSVVCLLVAVCLTVQALSPGFLLFTIFAVLAGVLTGSNVVLIVAVMMKCIGIKRYPSTIGLCGFIQGWFALFTGPLIGLVRDVSGNFSTCYLFIMSLQLLCALLWLTRYLYLHYTKSSKSSP